MLKGKSGSEAVGALHVLRPSLSGHLQIARADHWFKNVFVLPGIVVGLSLDPARATWDLALRVVGGLAAVCLVASSNYTLNELVDGPFDRHHPLKCRRPVPSGRVSIPLGYAQWIVLMVAGVSLSLFVSMALAMTMLALWVMGCVYNIPPLRTKDLPYLDVLTEAVNNPLRMLAGWFIVGPAVVPTASLLVSYWMVGCYFMALKRYAEYGDLGDAARAGAYRRSFAFYTPERLLVSIGFYASASMLFFGAFIVRYRLELILSFPLVALVMAMYLGLALRKDSPVQRPEGLYREPRLMVAVVGCALAMGILLFADVPVLHQIFAPSTIMRGATGMAPSGATQWTETR